MHSHQVVVSTLIQNATTAGLRPSADVPMLSGVLADFLNELILMSEQRLRKSSVKLADIIEHNILVALQRDMQACKYVVRLSEEERVDLTETGQVSRN